MTDFIAFGLIVCLIGFVCPITGCQEPTVYRFVVLFVQSDNEKWSTGSEYRLPVQFRMWTKGVR